jgi:hypothetical protein
MSETQQPSAPRRWKTISVVLVFLGGLSMGFALGVAATHAGIRSIVQGGGTAPACQGK